MASGFGTYTSSTRVSSSGAVVSTTVSQTVNTTARTVTVKWRVTAAYYRQATGSWTPGAGQAIYGSYHTGNNVRVTVNGTNHTLKSGGKVGVQSVSGVTYNNGSKYTIQSGKIAVRTDYTADWSYSETFNYDASGSPITGSWSARMYLPGLGTTASTVSGNFETDAITETPAGVTATPVSSTWDTVTGTVSVSNWSSLLSDKVLRLVVSKVAYTSEVASRYVAASASPATLTVNNSSTAGSAGSIDILGCGQYYVGAYASANSQEVRVSGGAIYTPPAPVSLSYIQATSTTWTLTLTGVAANNNSTYDASSLTRTLRYKIGSGSWTYIDDAAIKTITETTTSTITIAANQTATVEAWMEYHGERSEVATFTITNAAPVVHLYGSVSDQSKEIQHLYGSVSGQTVKITKLYASVGGVAKLIFQDT